MKKTLILLLFTLVLLVQVSALEIQTDKDDFKQGETFLATIQGNLLEPFEKTDIGFYEAHVQVPITFDLVKIQNTYHIYAVLPYLEKNLTLKIRDVYYKEQNIPKLEDIEKNFTITTELADFNVEPAAFLTNLNFTLSLYNSLGNDILLTYTAGNHTYTTTLPLQDSKDIKINISDFPSQTLSYLSLESDSGFSYQLPVYSTLETEEENQTEENQTIIINELLFFLISESNETLNKEEEITRTLELKNIGDEPAENITLILSSDIEEFVTLSTNQIDSLGVNETIEFEFVALFPETGNFSGFILAESENSFDKIDFNFDVGENVIVTSTTTTRKTCAQMGGKKCLICSVQPKTASDGICCLGICEEDIPDEPKKRNWAAIIVIIVALGIIALAIYLKLKKPKPTAEDILEKGKRNTLRDINQNLSNPPKN